jgi:hypothetical protein
MGKLVILAVVVLSSTFLATRAAVAGWGVPRPLKKPISLREESARGAPLGSGRSRTHYFVGGGFRGGK